MEFELRANYIGFDQCPTNFESVGVSLCGHPLLLTSDLLSKRGVSTDGPLQIQCSESLLNNRCGGQNHLFVVRCTDYLHANRQAIR